MESGITRFDKSYARLKELLGKVEKCDSYDDLSVLERELYMVYRRDISALVFTIENDIRKAFADRRIELNDKLVSGVNAVERVQKELAEEAKPVKKTAKKSTKKTAKKSTKKATKKA